MSDADFIVKRDEGSKPDGYFEWEASVKRQFREHGCAWMRITIEDRECHAFGWLTKPVEAQHDRLS